MKHTQYKSYNNLINYIKLQLGFPTSVTEFDDDFIMEYIQNQSLPSFSNFVPWKLKSIIIEPYINCNYNKGNIYKINIDKDIRLIEIDDIYTSRINSGNYYYNNNIFHNADSIIDIGIEGQLDNLYNSMSPKNIERYIPPSKENDYTHLVEFPFSIPQNGYVCLLNCIHDELQTIPSEHFELFQKWCLRDMVELLIAHRSKFSDLSTNIADIKLNIDFLTNRKSELDSEINEAKKNHSITDKCPILFD